MTAVSTSPFARDAYVRLISSIAKTIPASGVLNAAAIPAAEPASIGARACAMPPKRATASMIEAPT